MKITRTNTKLMVVAASDKERETIDNAFAFDVENSAFVKKNHEKVHKEKVKGCWMCNWDGKHHFFGGKSLPAGFLSKVEGLVDCDIEDARIAPQQQYEWNCSATLRDYQRNAVDAAIGGVSGIVEAATGAGKTIIAAGIVAELGLRTIIIVPTKVIYTQFIDTFKEFTDIDVGTIQGKIWEVDKPVVVAVMAGLTKDKKKTMAALAGRELIIIDEYHKSAAKTWYNTIAMCNAYYRFGLTATPFRKDQLGCEFLRACTGNVLSSIKTKTLQNTGYLSTTNIRIIKNDVYPPKYALDKEKQCMRKAVFVDKYRSCIATNPKRNTMIAEITNHHIASGEKVLIITAWSEHAHAIEDMLDVECIYLSGKDTAKKSREKAEAFKAMDGGVLIGTSVLDLGFDVPAIDVVIMAGAGDAKGRTQQRMGRGLRKSDGKEVAIIYDFLDNDIGGKKKYFNKHSINRIGTYTNLGQRVTIYDNVEEAFNNNK